MGREAKSSPMGFSPMSHLLTPALSEGYAVPAFCVWNAETIEAALRAAAQAAAMEAMRGVVGKWIDLTGAAGRARLSQ